MIPELDPVIGRTIGFNGGWPGYDSVITGIPVMGFVIGGIIGAVGERKLGVEFIFGGIPGVDPSVPGYPELTRQYR